ncbi:hypothetical protein [Neobacillus sp. D3-1R]|uniref:hypothetical protein n=1 Tax=Neobacillus sp. D3-1R TaxID=3445778 RepID=UPI003F9FB6FA
MVTAILIPAILFYFYWLSRKELKEYEKKWNNLNNLHEEAIVTGEILQLTVTKKRFYYHRFIQVMEIQLKTETKTIPVKRITPYRKSNESVKLKSGNFVRLYGNWQENEFQFLRYDVIN